MSRSTEGVRMEISISLEELALLLNLMGYPIVAKGFLVSQLGNIAAEEERGRLMAANHTLLAKDIITLEEGQLHIAAPYSELLDLLPNNDYAVRCILVSQGDTQRMLTYYIRGEQIVEQQIAFGVVHSLRTISSLDEVSEAIYSLLEIHTLQGMDHVTEYLSQAELEGLTTVYTDMTAASNRLQKLGWAKETADYFAQDNFEQRRRAGLLRVVMNPEQSKPSERGYMLLTGSSGRAWLMILNDADGGSPLIVQPATNDLVRRETMILLEPL